MRSDGVELLVRLARLCERQSQGLAHARRRDRHQLVEPLGLAAEPRQEPLIHERRVAAIDQQMEEPELLGAERPGGPPHEVEDSDRFTVHTERRRGLEDILSSR